MSQEASSEPMPTEVIVPRNPCDTYPRLQQWRSNNGHPCSPCLENIEMHSLHYRRLGCGHHFHSECAIEAMIRHGIMYDGTMYCRQCISREGDDDYSPSLTHTM